jgi:dihydrolipoamide dehydrogenase
MDNQYNLAVIGGGPGGYEAAIRASQLGMKVVLIEEKEMGGTCLNRGCIPVKSMLHSSEMYHMVRSCTEYGIKAGDVGFDYAKIISRRDSVVRRLRSGVEFLMKNNGITTIKGKAKIKDANTIEIESAESGNTAIKASKIIIATGSRAARPPVTGIHGKNVLDSDGVLDMESCPEKIVIIGGGVIGVEFATIFNMLGKSVTIIELADAILPGVDAEVTDLLSRLLKKRGIEIYTAARVKSVQQERAVSCVFEYGEKELLAEGDIVMVATGRAPNSDGIGLENAGIETEKGFIRTDEHLETSVKGIYAIGDVTGKALLAHVASAQGLVAAANAAGQEKKISYSVIPSCIYTYPEIASVGLTEKEAIKRGYDVKIGSFSSVFNGKSIIMGEKDGFVKIITDRATGEILGAHIIALRATDMIAEICVAMELEATISELSDTIHPHPTVSEMLMEAAHDAEGFCINKPKS